MLFNMAVLAGVVFEHAGAFVGHVIKVDGDKLCIYVPY